MARPADDEARRRPLAVRSVRSGHRAVRRIPLTHGEEQLRRGGSMIGDQATWNRNRDPVNTSHCRLRYSCGVCSPGLVGHLARCLTASTEPPSRYMASLSSAPRSSIPSIAGWSISSISAAMITKHRFRTSSPVDVTPGSVGSSRDGRSDVRTRCLPPEVDLSAVELQMWRGVVLDPADLIADQELVPLRRELLEPGVA